MGRPTSSARADAFIKVLKGLLRPLVRAMISQGVTAPVFYKLVKQAYVDVAAADLAKGENTVTDSRVSVITGIHRRDVNAMRGQDQTEDVALNTKVSTLSSVLGKWLAAGDFANEDGSPKALKRFGDDQSSFESLVRSVSRDVRPRTILDELIRQELVCLEQDDLVRLKTDAFLGPADLDQRVHFFLSNVGDHLLAATENLLADKPPFIERSVFYNRMCTRSVDKIEAQARVLGNEALLMLNRDANNLQQENKNSDDGTERFRFGVFFYREDEEDENQD